MSFNRPFNQFNHIKNTLHHCFYALQKKKPKQGDLLIEKIQLTIFTKQYHSWRQTGMLEHKLTFAETLDEMFRESDLLRFKHFFFKFILNMH